MRIITIIFLALLSGAPSTRAAIPNHKDVVQRARDYYAHLSGPQRAFCVTNKTAYDLRAEQVGTFFKQTGYAERSSDVIIYRPAGETFDILGDSTGRATPQWNRTTPTGFGPVDHWRVPADPNSILSLCPTAFTPPSGETCESYKSRIIKLITDTPCQVTR